MHDLLYMISKTVQGNSKVRSIKSCVDGQCEAYSQSVPLGKSMEKTLPRIGAIEKPPVGLLQRLSAMQGLTHSDSELSLTKVEDGENENEDVDELGMDMAMDEETEAAMQPDLAESIDQDMQDDMDTDIGRIKKRMQKQMNRLQRQIEGMQHGAPPPMFLERMDDWQTNRNLRITTCVATVCTTKTTFCAQGSCSSTVQSKQKAEKTENVAEGTSTMKSQRGSSAGAQRVNMLAIASGGAFARRDD